MKKVVCLSALCFFVFGLVGSLPAMDACCAAEHKDASRAAQDKSEAVDVGNKICPVMGEKINEKTKATYEYKGKIYNFCCPACIDEFKKNPEKYIKKIEAEKKKEDSMHEDSEHQHMH
ncbi:MAG: YHS domain-containing protein [Candidatus Omnitrophota bacterium]|nr:YHS domain-containing protein [Candidatus Omnitrophota bacterium]